MKLTKIEEVIPESRIVVISPHYDDVTFMMGGYFQSLRQAGLLEAKNVDVKLVFAQSNYQVRTGEANFDTSLSRLKFATGNRLLEDIQANNELLGAYAYGYELYNELECIARGKSFADSDMEFPHGMYEDFEDMDYAILDRMKKRFKLLAAQEDTAIVLPLAIKEHVDHFIVREAAAEIAALPETKATFYFQEDKPYGGIATEEELARTEGFIAKHKLESICYACDPEGVLDLAFKHYLSQVEEVYKVGVRARSDYWQSMVGAETGVDRICKYKKG